MTPAHFTRHSCPQAPGWFHACRCLIVGILLAATGCHSIGPKTIPNDRFDYSSALAESWKSMMLLNIVKTRYLDLPIFLDVGQVVSGYSLQTGVSVNGQIARTGAGDTFLGFGGQGTFTQNPTITYTPQTGDQFLKAFMEPVSPTRIFSLVQSGYAADFILQLGLESLNGLRNQPMSIASRAQADPDFFTVLKLLREIQDVRAVGLTVERPTNGDPATVMFFRSESATGEIQGKIHEAQRLLGLTPGSTPLRLVQSPLRGGPGELASKPGPSGRSSAPCRSAWTFPRPTPNAASPRRCHPPSMRTRFSCEFTAARSVRNSRSSLFPTKAPGSGSPTTIGNPNGHSPRFSSCSPSPTAARPKPSRHSPFPPGNTPPLAGTRRIITGSPRTWCSSTPSSPRR